MQSIRALETKEVSEKVMKAKFIHKVRVSSLLTPVMYFLFREHLPFST